MMNRYGVEVEEHVDEARGSTVVLGRMLGTYTDWSDSGPNMFILHEFEPVEALKLKGMPAGDLAVLYDDGKLEVYAAGGGDVLWASDMLEALRELPRAKAEVVVEEPQA